MDFDIVNREELNSVAKIPNKVEHKCIEEFGSGFIVLPFFEDKFLFKEENFGKLKKAIKETISANKDRWILLKVTQTDKNAIFYNFSIEDLGYKAGKKGSKDKPNELMTVYDKNNKKIFNIKYSHSWEIIDTKDKETVLGKIKELGLWQ